jgi:hypothetical protein
MTIQNDAICYKSIVAEHLRELSSDSSDARKIGMNWICEQIWHDHSKAIEFLELKGATRKILSLVLSDDLHKETDGLHLLNLFLAADAGETLVACGGCDAVIKKLSEKDPQTMAGKTGAILKETKEKISARRSAATRSSLPSSKPEPK